MTALELCKLIRDILEVVESSIRPDKVGKPELNPKSWQTLFENEKQLAMHGYAREEERHKLLVDKAKISFLIAGLTGTLGLGKLDVLIPSILKLNENWRFWGYILLAVAFLLITGAILVALLSLRVRNHKAASFGSDYVNKVFSETETVMNRSLANIYEQATKHNTSTNDKLANYVNLSLWLTFAGFVASVLLLALFAYTVTITPVNG